MNVVPLEPRTLARSRQTDRQHHRSLAGARGNRNNLSRRLPRDHWFRDGGFYCGCSNGGCFYCGSFRGDCGWGRSRSRPQTTSASTSATATTPWHSRSRFTCRRCRGWRYLSCRDGFRCARRLGLRSRRSARLNHRSRHWSCGRCVRLIVIEPRLQRLGGVGSLLGGTFSRLLAALQALGHPFAHIACL
jgi:hypothetical protein